MELQDVISALRNADAAGDADAARRLARIADSMMRTESPLAAERRALDAEREEI